MGRYGRRGEGPRSNAKGPLVMVMICNKKNYKFKWKLKEMARLKDELSQRIKLIRIKEGSVNHSSAAAATQVVCRVVDEIA